MAAQQSILSPSFYRQLQQLKIRTRRSFLGSRQGTHLSVRRGHGLEFADFRHYTAGDDYRHIDWGVYGRTDKLYIRQFREEQDLTVCMLVDTSGSMNYPTAEGKFERVKELSLALSYIALGDGHSVSVSLLGERRSPRFSGSAAIGRIERFLQTVTPQGEVDLRSEMLAAIAQLKLPGKCFIFSDFLYPQETIAASLNLLRGRNYELVLVHMLGSSELRLPQISSPILEDAETGEEFTIALDAHNRTAYAKNLTAHVQFLEEFSAKSGIAYILVPTNQTLTEVLFTRLPALGVLG